MPANRNNEDEQIRRATDDASESVKSGIDAVAKSFESVTDQFTNVLGFSGPNAEELARQSTHNIEAVSQASTVLVRGFQEVSQELLALAQDRLKKNTESLALLWQFLFISWAESDSAVWATIRRSAVQGGAVSALRTAGRDG